jgi:hypothetical protein
MNQAWQNLDDPTDPMLALVNKKLIAMSQGSPQKQRRFKVDPSLYIAFVPMERRWLNAKTGAKQKVQAVSPLFKCSARRIRFLEE